MIRILSLGLLTLVLALGQDDIIRVEQWRFHDGDDPRWAAPDFDDSGWQPSSWPRQRLALTDYAGTRWYRATASIPPGLAGQPLAIALSHLDEVYDVFANGVRIGRFGEWEPQPSGRFLRFTSFPIPPHLLPNGSGDPKGTRVHLSIRRWTGGSITHFAVFLGAGRDNTRHPPELGPALLMHTRQELRTISLRTAFAGNPLVQLEIVVVGLLSLAMFFAQRASRSNLWLGVALIAQGLPPLLGAALSMSSLPLRSPWATVLVGVSFLTAPLWCRFLVEISPAWLRTPLLVMAVAQIGYAFAVALGYGLQLPVVSALFVPEAWIGLLIPVVAAISMVLDRRKGTFSLALAAALTLEPLAYLWMSELAPWFGAARFLRVQGFIIDPRNVALLIFGVTTVTVIYLRLREEQRRQAGIDRELAAARLVQESLLAGPAVATPGFAVESAYLPASEVGGDFYQELAGPDGSLLVLVGDVSGKGMRAALLVGHISGALSNERSRQSAEVLANLNRSLLGRVSGGFVTCCCARFDADGMVTVANAGHLAPYMGGREVEVEAGLPLGVVGGVAYAESSLRLDGPLMLMSDGVVEAENAQRELFGFDRTREISTKSAQEIAEAAKAWGQNDDITVVTVRRNS